jgi:Flp pilus assembly protein TadG
MNLNSPNSRRGGLLLESALMLPVLLLLAFGMVDFARIFRTGIVVSNAAATGALYGSASVANSSNTTAMQNAAIADANGQSGFAATASTFCTCSAGGTSVSCSTTCGAGSVLIYVQVQTSAPFNTWFPFPGVPSSTTVRSTVTMRAQ